MEKSSESRKTYRYFLGVDYLNSSSEDLKSKSLICPVELLERLTKDDKKRIFEILQNFLNSILNEFEHCCVSRLREIRMFRRDSFTSEAGKDYEILELLFAIEDYDKFIAWGSNIK